MSSKKKSVISQASPHTIKKFELIEEYIKSWAEKLLLTGSCNGLIFIDCMCNSGVYIDDAGQVVRERQCVFQKCFGKWLEPIRIIIYIFI